MYEPCSADRAKVTLDRFAGIDLPFPDARMSIEMRALLPLNPQCHSECAGGLPLTLSVMTHKKNVLPAIHAVGNRTTLASAFKTLEHVRRGFKFG